MTGHQPFYFSFGACLEPLGSTADCPFHAALLLSMSVLLVGSNELKYFVNFQKFDNQIFFIYFGLSSLALSQVLVFFLGNKTIVCPFFVRSKTILLHWPRHFITVI